MFKTRGFWRPLRRCLDLLLRAAAYVRAGLVVGIRAVNRELATGDYLIVRQYGTPHAWALGGCVEGAGWIGVEPDPGDCARARIESGLREAVRERRFAFLAKTAGLSPQKYAHLRADLGPAPHAVGPHQLSSGNAGW